MDTESHRRRGRVNQRYTCMTSEGMANLGASYFSMLAHTGCIGKHKNIAAEGRGSVVLPYMCNCHVHVYCVNLDVALCEDRTGMNTGMI